MSNAASSSLNEKGRRNFDKGRRGIKQGLLREYDILELTDVIWGLFVGVVQLNDVKSYRTSRSPSPVKANRKLGATLELAKKIVTDAIALS